MSVGGTLFCVSVVVDEGDCCMGWFAGLGGLSWFYVIPPTWFLIVESLSFVVRVHSIVWYVHIDAWLRR